MLESIWDWIKFWGDCLRDGIEVGDCIFGFSELALVFLVGWLTYKKRHDLSRYWEDKSVKWIWIILGVAFAGSTLFVAPFLKFQQASDVRQDADKLKPFIQIAGEKFTNSPPEKQLDLLVLELNRPKRIKEYESIFPELRTQIQFSQQGCNAFQVGDYDWSIKFFAQAKDAPGESEGSWRSNWPLLAASLLIEGYTSKGNDELSQMIKSIKGDISKKEGLWSERANFHWVLESLGDVRPLLGPTDKAHIDEITEQVKKLSKKASSDNQ